VLCSFDPTHRGADDGRKQYCSRCESHQHPVADDSRNLTVAEQNYPAHVLELLAVVQVHALCAFLHYLLEGGTPQPAGCLYYFDLQTDNQAIM
jgi:hypothetical protein